MYSFYMYEIYAGFLNLFDYALFFVSVQVEFSKVSFSSEMDAQGYIVEVPFPYKIPIFYFVISQNIF